MSVFICYDKNQKQYFEKNGFKDIVYGLHPKTFKPFWIYERDKIFDEYFIKWLSQKKR